MLGSIGTPIIAVESGYVEAIGWNRYGGWRIGIRSFDGKRYYYYAHLRRNHPYADMYEGKIVTAGDVIGYLGMTGYSSEENKTISMFRICISAYSSFSMPRRKTAQIRYG